MTTIRPILAAAALTASLARVAAAQEPPPQTYEQPPQTYEAPPQQTYAPPPGYAPPQGYEPQPPAMVPAAVTLGAAGQIVLSDDLLVTATRTSFSSAGTSVSSTSITLQPAIDFFVAPNLSIGGQLRIGISSSDYVGDQTTIGLLPRIGYNIPIGAAASIWPRGSLAYVHYSNSVSSTGVGTTSSSYTVSFIAFVPVLFQPAPHFFVGGGPFLSTDLVSKSDDGFGNSVDGSKATEFGLLSTLGGYFGGI
jgi:hypothetical protein